MGHRILCHHVSDTTIPIEADTRDKLRAEKIGGETYTEVIERLLKNNNE